MLTSLLPVILAVLVIGIFAVSFHAMRVCFERRDALLDLLRGENPITKDQATLIFRTDWQSLWLGTCYFLLISTVCLVLLPEFIPLPPEGALRFVARAACYLAATLPFFGLLANVTAGFDVKSEVERMIDDTSFEKPLPRD